MHRAAITEDVKEFGEIGTAGLLDSKISETSYFQSKMHFDDSVESIADSDLEDGELQKMLTSPLYAQKSQDWRYRTHNTDLLNLDENKSSTTRRIICEGKGSPRQRIDEVSVRKLRENHETIQQLTLQLQQMQEQMNSVSDSGDFEDVESYCSGRSCHVSSQPVMIPSSRSLLSRDKRLPLDTWDQSGLQENVFGNQFSTFDSPKDYPQRNQSDDVQRNPDAAPEAGRTKTGHTSEDRQNQGTIPMPTFATRPLTTNSTIPVELLQIYMVAEQRQQMSELQFDRFPNPSSFWCGKQDSKKQRPQVVLIFRRKLCSSSKKWRWSILWRS